MAGGESAEAFARRLRRERLRRLWPGALPRGEPPAAPWPVGATVLLGYERRAEGRPLGALWRFAFEPPERPEGVARPDTPRLAGEAFRLALRAPALAAARGAALLLSADELHRPWHWLVEPLHAYPEQGLPSRVLDGRSYGLALALAAASRLAGRPLAPTLVGLATVADDGALGPVDGLEAKLAALCDAAARPLRLLVARGAGDEVRARLREAQIRLAGAAGEPPAHRVQEVAHLSEAVGLAGLSEPADELPPERARAAARLLFRLALRNEVGLAGWQAVQRTAETLLHQPGLEPPEHERLRFARQVAARRRGEPLEDDEPGGPALAGRIDPVLRLELLAHEVMGACSQPSLVRWEATAERAASTLAELRPEAPWPDEALELLGSLGRALGQLADRWDVAQAAGAEEPRCSPEPIRAATAELLEAAVAGWWARAREPQAVRPLCELLRQGALSASAPGSSHPPLEGALPWLASLRERLRGLAWRAPAPAEALAEELLLHPSLDPVSAAYLRLALARRAGLIGEPAEALSQLHEQAADWAAAPPDARLARRLWWRRAAGTAPDPRQPPAPPPPPEAPASARRFYEALEAIDGALRAGDGERAREAIAELLGPAESVGEEARLPGPALWLLAPLRNATPSPEAAAALARCWGY